MPTNPNIQSSDPDHDRVTSFDYAAEFERAQPAGQPQTPEAAAEHIPDELGNEALDLLYDDLQWEWYKYNDFARPKPPSFRTEAEVTDTALKYLASKPVGYEVTLPEEAGDPEEAARGEKVQLAIGGQAVAGIRFYIQGHTADLDFIGVHSRLEHHGLGRRLMQSALAYMKDRGITELNSRNLTRDGFRNRLAVFGPDNLSFFYTDEHREHGVEGPPPANVQEAQAAMDRAYAKADAEGDTSQWWRGDAPPTFGVQSELSKVEATDWERPVPAHVGEMRVQYN